MILYNKQLVYTTLIGLETVYFIQCQCHCHSPSLSVNGWALSRQSVVLRCGELRSFFDRWFVLCWGSEWAAVGFEVTPFGQHLWPWLMANTCESWKGGGEHLCHDLLNRWQTSSFGCPDHHSSFWVCQIFSPTFLFVLALFTIYRFKAALQKIMMLVFIIS